MGRGEQLWRVVDKGQSKLGNLFIQHVQFQLKLTEWVQAKGMRARQRIERKAAYLHELQAQVAPKYVWMARDQIQDENCGKSRKGVAALVVV